MSWASSVIVRGRVRGHESRWNDTRTRIVTLTAIDVEDKLKGEPPSTIMVEQPGGRVGNIRVDVPGTTRLVPGATYYLFLEPAIEPRCFRLVGMAQGACAVYRHPLTHEERVIRPFGSTFYGKRQAGASIPASSTMAVGEFLRVLARAIEAPPALPGAARLPLAVHSTRPLEDGRVLLEGRTTSAVYPDPKVAIPAGSSVKGVASRVRERWSIRWTEMGIRGVSLKVDGTSEISDGEMLPGRRLVAIVR